MESSCGGHSFGGRRNDDACVLNFGLGGEFLVGEDIEFWQGGFEKALEGEAELGAEEDGGDEALLGHGVGADGEFAQEVLGGLGVEGERGLEMGTLDAGDEGLLEARVEGDGFDEAGLGFVLGDEIGAEAFADLLGEFVGIFGDGGVVGEGLEDGLEVADRHAFPQEGLEDLLEIARLFSYHQKQ